LKLFKENISSKYNYMKMYNLITAIFYDAKQLGFLKEQTGIRLASYKF